MARPIIGKIEIGWVNLKEKGLPSVDGDVLVYIKGESEEKGNITIGRYSSDTDEWMLHKDFNGEITHWQYFDEDVSNIFFLR